MRFDSSEAVSPNLFDRAIIHPTIQQQSNVIVEYLELRYPEPRLLPDDPSLAAEAREWMVAEQDYLFPAIVTLSFNTMMKIRVKVFGMEQLAEWSKAFPDQEKAQDYLQRMSAPENLEAAAAAEKKFDFHMQRLQKQLNKHDGPWICGAQFTVADICLAGIIDRIEYLDKAELYEKYTEVDEWFKQLEQRDSYQKGLHQFKERMWGPLKPAESYPFKEDPKHCWGYWKSEE